jgi:hypothetical protein
VGSIVIERCAGYPGEEDRFSPDQRFPEYRHSRIAARPNPVYGAVRNCLARCQLDEARLGDAEWNPLGRWIKPGNNVFILCNFVYHRRARET